MDWTIGGYWFYLFGTALWNAGVHEDIVNTNLHTEKGKECAGAMCKVWDLLKPYELREEIVAPMLEGLRRIIERINAPEY